MSSTRAPRRRATVLTLAVAALAGVPATAGATTVPLPVTAQAPADGASAPASNYPVATDAEMLTFSVDLPAPVDLLTPVSVEVATTPALGLDGTLSDDDKVAGLTMTASDTNPLHYVARTEPFNAWLGRPGTYYWTASYWTLDLDQCAAGCTHVAPVRSFTLTAPKVVLGRAEAEEQAALALAQRYGARFTKRATDVHISCATRLSATVRRCAARWQRKGIAYRARLDVVEKPRGAYAYRNARLTTRR